MGTIGEASLWLAVVLAAWVPATAAAGAARDERLTRSGARALHAVAVLLLVALAMRIAGATAELSEAPRGLAAAIAVRGLWTEPVARLTLWAAAVAGMAAAVPGIVRHDRRPVRAGAQLRAGLAALAFAAAAAGASLLPTGGPDGDATAPVAVHVAAGLAGRLLLVVGCAAIVVPLALAHAERHREAAARWSVGALAGIVAALLLLAHTHYASAAAPSVLDASGAPAAPPWSSLSALWMLPLLAAGAIAYRLSASIPGVGDARARSAARAASLLLLALAAIVILAAVAPAVVDWTEAREMEAGFELRPPLLVLVALPTFLAGIAILGASWRDVRGQARRDFALGVGGAISLAALAAAAGVRSGGTLAAVAAAGSLAALLAGRGVAARELRYRAGWFAQCAAVVAAGAAVAASSVPPERVEAIPGTPVAVTLAGREFQLGSQGVSQDETPAYDGIVVAFDVQSAGDSRIVTAGERAYRDAHGHAAARVAVPAVLRGWAGDLRLVVVGARGAAAGLQVQYHPLAALAWLAGVATVVALIATAAAPRPSITSPEEVQP